jgi:hypothetical protein
MKHWIRSLLIAAVPLSGIGLVGMAASAGGKDCRDVLFSQFYQCRFVYEGDDVDHPMYLEFSGPEFGGPEYSGPEPGLAMEISGPELGSSWGYCACKTLAGNVKKPDKIKFQRKKDFHCLTMTGADATTGAEFRIFDASIEGQVRGKKIKKGEGLDIRGRTLAFACEVQDPDN